jgi:hypothetical protein
VIVVFVSQLGSALATFIVYVVPLSQLTTVSASSLPEMVVSIALILSYTAFLLGAVVFTQFQLLEYAVLLILLEVSNPVTAPVLQFTLVTQVLLTTLLLMLIPVPAVYSSPSTYSSQLYVILGTLVVILC